MTTEALLPSAWRALFDGERLADKINETAMLSTVDEAGWPHVAFLGMGEIVEVRRHEAPDAHLDGLTCLRLDPPEPTLERWSRQVEEMKQRL